MTARHNIDWDNVRSRIAQCQSQQTTDGMVDRERLERVFRQRAQQLAQRHAQRSPQATRSPLLIFKRGNETYGLELANVKQVYTRVPLTLLPGTNQLALRVAHLDDALRTVVDLSALFSTPAKLADEHSVVLIRTRDKSIGVIVDSIEDLCDVDMASLATNNGSLPDSIGTLARGITETGVRVLDADAIIEQVRGRRYVGAT